MVHTHTVDGIVTENRENVRVLISHSLLIPEKRKEERKKENHLLKSGAGIG